MQQGVKNYITPAGIERLRGELHRLRRVERPEVVATVSWAAGNGDRSENGDYIYGKGRLRQIDDRIRTLLQPREIDHDGAEEGYAVVITLDRAENIRGESIR